MYLRTIMIFPDFDNMDIIEKIRARFDPLRNLVRPHITLVFPFQDQISNEELKRKMQECLAGIKPFRLILQGVSKQEDIYGNYLFLNVIEGSREIINLHDILYTSLWNNAMDKQVYVPHMTIGKLSSVEKLNKAFAEIMNMDILFETSIKMVSVEMIGENEESIIIIEQKF